MMRRALVLLALAACQKAGPKPAPEPADLLLVVSVASPKATLARVASYADAVSPGSGASLEPGVLLQGLQLAVGAPGLDGIDLDKPLHLVLLDPKKHPRPVIVSAAVADEEKVKKTTGATVKLAAGRVAVGDAPALEVASAYALSLTSAPGSPTLRLSPGKLVARYRDEIEAFRKNAGAALGSSGGSPSMARILEWEIDLLVKLADQTDELRFSGDASSAEAFVEIALVPRPGSDFAKFNAAQKPGLALDLLAGLPAVEKPTMIMAGRYDMGPLREQALDLIVKLLESGAGAKVDRAAWASWLEQLDGTAALVSWQNAAGAMQMHEVFGVADGPRAAAGMRKLLAFDGTRDVDVLGFKMSWQTRPAVATHAGIEIDEVMTRIDLSALPEMQREMMRKMYGEDGLRVHAAGAGKRFAITFGTEGLEAMKRLLDARGPSPLPPAARSALDAAAKRDASVALFFDMAQTMAPLVGRPLPPSSSGMLFDVGFTGGAATMRIGVPSAHVKEIMAAVVPR